jgi:hypothetical protein
VVMFLWMLLGPSVRVGLPTKLHGDSPILYKECVYFSLQLRAQTSLILYICKVLGVLRKYLCVILLGLPAMLLIFVNYIFFPLLIHL